jgi:ferredoxin
MFARMELVPGSPQYEDYYSRRPDARPVDDRIRTQPRLLRPGGTHYDPEITRQAEEFFRAIDEIEVRETVLREWSERLRSAGNPTSTIKELLLSQGAVTAGCTALDERFVYTHKGRFPEDYGREIDLDHPSAIVFLVEMDFDEMQWAPKAETIRESARQYYRAARISMVLEKVLRATGHAAKAHYDAHYDLVLPPLAVAAGLGELGRNNILIADRFGSRVRIGAVTTDFPVEYDEPVSLGADALCGVCLKCAENCPSRSLSLSEKVDVKGVRKWPTRVEACYAYWRRVGTDCGVCMASCPFSHRDNRFHNFVRWMIRRFGVTRRPAIFLENLFYGRRWKPR